MTEQDIKRLLTTHLLWQLARWNMDKMLDRRDHIFSNVIHLLAIIISVCTFSVVIFGKYCQLCWMTPFSWIEPLQTKFEEKCQFKSYLKTCLHLSIYRKYNLIGVGNVYMLIQIYIYQKVFEYK